MADIFISYKREDANVAKLVADSLIASGWTVWWDRNIPIGKAFDQVIDEELSKSKCVIVLWSPLSIMSLNVKEEASEGLKRNILIPIAIGDVKPPYGFRMIQTKYCKDVPQHEELQVIIDQVKQLIGDPTKEKPAKPASSEVISNDQNILEKAEKKNSKQILPKYAKLRFIRKNKWFGQLLSFAIFIDREKVGTLSVGETLEIPVEAGTHILRVTGGGSLSDADAKISVMPNEIMSWEVGYTIIGGARLSKI